RDLRGAALELPRRAPGDGKVGHVDVRRRREGRRRGERDAKLDGPGVEHARLPLLRATVAPLVWSADERLGRARGDAAHDRCRMLAPRGRAARIDRTGIAVEARLVSVRTSARRIASGRRMALVR